MLGRLGAARRGRLPGLTGRGALVMRHAHGACTLGAQRASDTTPSGAPVFDLACPQPSLGLRLGTLWAGKPCRRHGLRRAPGSTRACGPMDAAAVPRPEPPAALSLSATQSPWACLVVSSGGHAHLSERTSTMARSAEDIRLTGIDMHQGAPAPEPPRVPRISLTFSGLPPADGHTILTRECGVARQTLGREARIEDSSLLTDGGPHDRDQHHRDSLQEDVQHTEKCSLCMAQRPEAATRPLPAAQIARQR